MPTAEMSRLLTVMLGKGEGVAGLFTVSPMLAVLMPAKAQMSPASTRSAGTREKLS